MTRYKGGRRGPTQATFGLAGNGGVGNLHPDVVIRNGGSGNGIPRTLRVGAVYNVPAVMMPGSAQIRPAAPQRYVPLPKFPTQGIS